jgi:hypothetical protein
MPVLESVPVSRAQRQSVATPSMLDADATPAMKPLAVSSNWTLRSSTAEQQSAVPSGPAEHVAGNPLRQAGPFS